MIHLVLDTSIYRNNPDRDSLHFKAIERLSNAGSLQLHIPYVVLREFQTQQREIYSKDLTKSLAGLNGLVRKKLDKNILDDLDQVKNELTKREEEILTNAEDQLSNWAGKIGASVYPLCIDQSKSALEAYFKGNPPLKKVKTRDDIPDSFIVQAIYKLYSEIICPIHVVAGDKKIRDVFCKMENFTTYETLLDFVGTDFVQNALKEFGLIANTTPVINSIKSQEEEEKSIGFFLSENIGEFLVWQKIHDPSINDDNNEATINGYGTLDDLVLDFPNAGYYGGGEFGIPYDAKIMVQAHYYIFKSEYYVMDADKDPLPSITDHNDHYFEAEEEFELCISGLVSVYVKSVDGTDEEIQVEIDTDKFEIDDLIEITLC